jgi:hypothetical protein
MTDSTTTPYIDRKPGDLITADDWVRLQTLIKADIAKQVGDAVSAITSIASADDAAKLGGLTPAQLSQQVLDYVERQLPKRTGYLSVFRKLEVGKESVIDHKLGTWPLMTVFQLDYFPVVASEDDQVFEPLATFFLHHKNEGRIRYRPTGDADPNPRSMDIDPPGQHPYHIPWAHMLELYNVDTPDDATLDEVESEFWQKFNAPPNDTFDDDQYYHSPWFDRCCGERRSVKQLARDWDDIYFQMRPRLTLDYTRNPDQPTSPTVAPSQVQAVHYDLQSSGLVLLGNPVVPPDWPTDHLKVLALLKV